MYYVGMDIHKKTVTYHVLTADGRVVSHGTISASKQSLEGWAVLLPKPWTGAMESTLFTHHVYETLKPYAHDLVVGDSLKMRNMNPHKHKNDDLDAEFASQLVRCGLVPCAYVPDALTYELRQVLRFRNKLLREGVRMRNKTAGLLMESGVEYDKRRLHGEVYFAGLVESLEDVPETVVDLLKQSKGLADLFYANQKKLLNKLSAHPALHMRVKRLQKPDGIGPVTALTWALETGDPLRFRSVSQAISYCGLCAAEEQSAGKRKRHGRLSRRCNMALRNALIEAAKLAPRRNPQLAEVYERAYERTQSENLATIAVARKLVAWLLAIDKRKEDFVAHPH
jgi:transposase